MQKISFYIYVYIYRRARAPIHSPISLSHPMMDSNSTTLTAPSGRDQIQNPIASSYVLNGKIMFCSVILLFVVVFILVCFHSYASWLRYRHRHRYRYRHRHRRAHRLFFLSSGANTMNTAPPHAHQALDLSILKRIPAFVYSPNIEDPKEPLDCAVCLSEFEDNENGRVLPKCRHVFHVDCIDMWFQSHSNCPLCRAPVQLDITLVHPLVQVEEVVSVIEPTERDLGVVHQMGCSSSSSSSSSLPQLESVSVEIPRARENFRGLDDMGLSLTNERNGFKSPGNRVLTLKRIWSI